MTRPMRLATLFTLAIPVAALAAGAYYIMDLRTGTGPALTYDTVEVSRGTIRKVVSTSGPVRALVTVSVGSQLSGQVETVNADFNSEVKPNDILATLDRRTFEARAQQAEADLSAARAALTNQKAALVKSQAVLKVAERTIARQKSLASKGFSSQSALDNAERDRDVALADISVADAQIESAKATIAQRTAALEQAKIDLERTDIRSPIAGTVISRTVDPGQTVAASLQAPELFKIAQDLSLIRIEAQVNEADVGSLREGNPVTFTVDAYPDREFEGRVTQVRLAATEINNVVTYTVIIEAKNDDRRLFPGMTANTQIESARKEGVLRIPNDALRYRPRGGQEKSPDMAKRMSERVARTMDRLDSEIGLTDTQKTAVGAALGEVVNEMQKSRQPSMGGGSFDGDAFRQRLMSKIEQVLPPLLDDGQRRLFDKWKSGRESVKTVQVYVAGVNGEPERRTIRIGLQDDQYTEIAGGEMKEGDKVVTRAREGQP